MNRGKRCRRNPQTRAGGAPARGSQCWASWRTRSRSGGSGRPRPSSERAGPPGRPSPGSGAGMARPQLGNRATVNVGPF